MATKTWKIEKDLCRCCHAEGTFDNLAEPRTFLEKEEIYSDMLRECLDVDIPPVPGELCSITYTICNACITRLRDACNFKKQVQDCEQRFMTLYYKNAIQCINTETRVKEELEMSLEDNHSDEDAEGIVLKKEEEDDDDEDSLMDRDDDDDDDMSEDYSIKKPTTSMKTRSKPKAKTKAPPVKKEKPQPQTRKKAEPKPVKEKKGDVQKMLSIIQPEDFKKDGDNYVCNHCNKIYDKRNSLRFHIRAHHYSQYGCPYCEQKFKKITPLTVHKLKEHDVDDRVSCNACKGKFNSQVALKKHIRVFHMLGTKYSCKMCDYETYDREGLYKHKFKHKTVKDFHCRFCKKSFMRKTNLNLHEKIHTDERSKVCKVCGQGFVQKASLNYHMNKYHPEVDY